MRTKDGLQTQSAKIITLQNSLVKEKLEGRFVKVGELSKTTTQDHKANADLSNLDPKMCTSALPLLLPSLPHNSITP